MNPISNRGIIALVFWSILSSSVVTYWLACRKSRPTDHWEQMASNVRQMDGIDIGELTKSHYRVPGQLVVGGAEAQQVIGALQGSLETFRVLQHTLQSISDDHHAKHGMRERYEAVAANRQATEKLLEKWQRRAAYLEANP